MHDQGQPHGPLAGFTVGVTAARRADELGALLQRRGAAVLHAPALRIVPLADDTELLAATKGLIDHAPDVAVATTAIGFRGWVEAADGWGLGEQLRVVGERNDAQRWGVQDGRAPPLQQCAQLVGAPGGGHSDGEAREGAVRLALVVHLGRPHWSALLAGCH